MKRQNWNRILSGMLTLFMLIPMILHAGAFEVAVVKTEERTAELTAADGSVTIAYGPDAGIPDDAALTVRAIGDDGAYRAAAERIAGFGETLAWSEFLDISIVDGSGAEIEPQAPVSVRMALPEGMPEKGRVRLIHFTQAPDAELTPAGDLLQSVRPTETDGMSAEAGSVPGCEIVEAEVEDGVLSFTADGFSVYGIVSYTVDFEYNVDGQTFSFSMKGGSGIGFSELLPVLGVVTDNPETEEDEVRSFVDGIMTAEFSDPELVWLGKAESDTTVGALIQQNGLEPEYSADLTEEDIAAINDTPVTAGDWVLISLAPFTTDETLTVTMRSGEVFVILVTDAQYIGTAVNLNNLDGAKGALVRGGNPVNAVQGIARNSNHLEAAAVTFSGSQLSTNGSTQLTEWEFTKVPGTNDRYYIHCDGGYLNIGAGSATVSASNQQELIVQINGNQLRIRRTEDQYALNNDSNNTNNGYSSYSGSAWNNPGNYQNPGEWFTLYALEVPHVTIHYVDRNGNVLTNVQYKGTNTAVKDNGDGTFEIPYATSGTIDLRANFNFDNVVKENEDPAPYTYGSTHLDGYDADGTKLKQNGLVIDSVLSGTGSTLNFASDSGETNWNPSGNPPMGNLKYGDLTSGSLADRISRRPSNNGDIQAYAISNNKDIYVILDPLPVGAVNPDGLSAPDLDAAAPTLDKEMEDNGDGTYTLSLTVDTDLSNGGTTNKANVLFVVDTSSSMRTVTTNGKNRIQDTHDSVRKLGDDLLAYNTTHPNAVEVSMITFDGRVVERLPWTSVKGQFDNAVETYLKYFYLHTGTDWEDALNEALKKLDTDTDDDPTFVIFFTDGEPSQYTNFHGAGTNGNADPTGSHTGPVDPGDGYPNFYSYFLSRETAKDEMRALVDKGVFLYGIYAYNNDSNGYTSYNGRESGGVLLHNALKYGYNSSESLEGKAYFPAENTTQLNAAFAEILKSITDSVGFTNVVVKDGITTGVTSSTVVDGDVSGFTYTIRDNKDALVYQVKVAPNGVSELPAGTPAPTDGTPIFFLSDGSVQVGQKKTISVDKIKVDGDGQPILDANNKIQTESVEVEVYYYKGPGADDPEYIMPIATTGTTVVWDLSPLGVLKDGYSYDVSFVVWPNQEAYDLVADLNNGKRTDLTETWSDDWTGPGIFTDKQGRKYQKNGIEGYPYIILYEDGTYAALSNSDQEIDYYKKQETVENGELVEEYKGPFETPVDPPDPMRLTAARSHIEKQWNVSRDPVALAQFLYNPDGTPKKVKIPFEIYVKDPDPTTPENPDPDPSGDPAQQPAPYKIIELGWYDDPNYPTKSGYRWEPGSEMHVTYNGHDCVVGTRWAANFAIATGLILSEDQMDEHGLNKSKYPSGVWKGVTYYVLEDGHDYTVKEPALTYEFDFDAPVYHPMLVDNVLKSVTFTKSADGKTVTFTDMTDNEAGLSGLVFDNTLRGYINLEKDVVDKDNAPFAEDTTEFTYSVQLTNPNHPGPFKVEGSHIPWYGIDGLFYHDENLNYYQASFNETGALTLKDESGRSYAASCDVVFDEDVGPYNFTYTDSTGQEQHIQLSGNRMDLVDANHVKIDVLKINQNQVLSIANVPVDTVYEITEASQPGYTPVGIEWEIRPAPDEDTVVPDPVIAGSKITGTIVANRDNHIVYTNKFQPGALKITKIVKVDNAAPTSEQYSLVDGNYVFLVKSVETEGEGEDAVPLLTKYVQITVTNGTARTYRIADTQAGLADAEEKTGSWAVVGNLPEGDYTVEETGERNGLLLTGAVRKDGHAAAVDAETLVVTLHVSANDAAAANTNAQAEFTNNYYKNNGPDKIALDIRKTFVGLTSEADLPDGFEVHIRYDVPGHNDLEFVLRKNQDETVELNGAYIRIKETTDGYSLNWHITGIPSNATNFEIKESGYDPVTGYTFLTAALNGTDIKATAGDWHDMTIVAPTADLKKVTDERETSDSPSNRKFKLLDGDILLSKLTANQGTLVISKTALNTVERDAVEKGWPKQGGFKKPAHYFSIEEHPNGFSYGNKTITFSVDANGDTIVEMTSNASAQEDVFEVTYDSHASLNNAELTNTYEPITVSLNLIKVDATDMTTTLKGAQFTISELDPDGRGNILTGEGAFEEMSSKTGADGMTGFTGIPDGYYVITEIKLPDGYIHLDDGKFYIKIVHGVITRIEKGVDNPDTEDVDESVVKNWPEMLDNTGRIRLDHAVPAVPDDPETNADESVDAVYFYLVGNTPGPQLPSTGGRGLRLLYLAGGTAILLFGAALTMRMRKRRDW